MKQKVDFPKNSLKFNVFSKTNKTKSREDRNPQCQELNREYTTNLAAFKRLKKEEYCVPILAEF